MNEHTKNYEKISRNIIFLLTSLILFSHRAILYVVVCFEKRELKTSWVERKSSVWCPGGGNFMNFNEQEIFYFIFVFYFISRPLNDKRVFFMMMKFEFSTTEKRKSKREQENNNKKD